jgi:hypothetical protein
LRDGLGTTAQGPLEVVGWANGALAVGYTCGTGVTRGGGDKAHPTEEVLGFLGFGGLRGRRASVRPQPPLHLTTPRKEFLPLFRGDGFVIACPFAARIAHALNSMVGQADRDWRIWMPGSY